MNGESIPPEEFIARAKQYLAAVDADPKRPRDNSRVVIVGAFCEQPPLGLIKSIERAGCYIVDDDFLAGNRFLTEAVPTEGDPAANLARTFTSSALKTSVLYEPDPKGKKTLMQQRAKAARADGLRVDLTAREWAVLEALVLRAGRIVPKADLERLVLGFESELASNALEVHVSALRRKLGRELIETVRGLGYRIGEAV